MRNEVIKMADNGKVGEMLFKQIMESSGYSVMDVSGEPQYWDKDIDFVITSPTTGITKTFEVKWDSRINNTGNLYLEIANSHSKGCKGWYEFCEADYLVYGDAQAQYFYIIPLLELRERVKQLPQRLAQCGNDSIG
jgi:hypothetical protein